MIQSVLACQKAYAKALLVNRRDLREAQRQGDIVGAEETLVSAFETDVEPLLHEFRARLGIERDPLKAYRASGYERNVARQRETVQGGVTLG